MDTNELISRFLSETKYDEFDTTLLILAYGSRITGINNPYSDLDVLIVTSQNKSYKRAMMVDGIPIDVTIMSIYDLEKSIHQSLLSGSTYYHSILKHSITILDRMNTLENVDNMLNNKIKRKRFLDIRLLEQAEYHIKEFVSGDKNHHYYAALEALRKLHHANNNCSNIRYTKVYDLYIDTKVASDIYMVKLPNDEYRQKYIKALSEENHSKRLEYLIYFYHEFEHAKFKEKEDKYFLSEDEIKRRIFYLNNAIWKCEDMLLHHHPYAKSLYYILINEIYSLYELVYSIPMEEIDYDSDNPDIMFDNLEELFAKLDENYRMDYNDVLLRL